MGLSENKYFIIFQFYFLLLLISEWDSYTRDVRSLDRFCQDIWKLRKINLFSSDIWVHFLLFTLGGDYDVDTAALFIEHKFHLLNSNRTKEVYTHFTTATDTANIQFVFKDVMDTVIGNNIRQATLL